MPETTSEVVVQIDGEDIVAGRLWSHRRGKAESATFAYDSAYLSRPDAYQLDPALPMVSGQQQTAAGMSLFRAFSDSAPDRWGRRVMARNAERAADDQGGDRGFGEIDYLLGVRDDMRQGALRYRDPNRGVFLADERTGVPPLVELPQLLSAADRLERDAASEEQLRLLLRGGSSLGGARPKANVLLDDGRAAIAKFPSPNDDHDVIRWEAVTLELARASGIEVADWSLRQVDGKPVLLIDRFDRAEGRRIGYVSAMTMLEADDGSRGSYLEIAEAIEDNSPAATAELRQLWRRIAFSVLVSNTDDHLRNHGFLRRSSAGWSLSPAFDLNPDPEPGEKHLATSIGLDDDRASLELLLDVADQFRLGETEARGIVDEVRSATEDWRSVAARNGLPPSARDRMSPAFEHPERAAATGLRPA